MIHIRLSEECDINIIMEIWLESTIRAHSFIEKDYWVNNYDLVKTKYIPYSKTYVYEEGNKIKGFISIIENNFIGALFVDNNSEGNGIGKKLLDFAKKEYKSLSLAVYKENEKALKFYLREGFSIVKEQVNEYSKRLELMMEYK